MSRGPVWIEAYEHYLLKTRQYQEDVLDRLSDDELTQLFYQYVKEKDVEKEANSWIHKYCRQWM